MNTTATVDFGLLARAGGNALTVAAGETVFAQGDAGDQLYVVKSGLIEIRLGTQVVDTVGPNGIFGEMAIIERAPRSATAVAAEDSVLVPVNERQFLLLVGEMPYFALNLLRLLSRRLRLANKS